MPPIGIPGSIDWPVGKADAYYFATLQMRQKTGVSSFFMTSAADIKTHHESNAAP